MIYIASDNFFLCFGIRAILHPFEVSHLTTQQSLENALMTVTSSDFILLDADFSCDPFIIRTTSNVRLKIVILNHAGQEIDFVAIDYFYYSLDIKVSLMRLAENLYSLISNEISRISYRKTLSNREGEVLKNTLKGMSVNEIALMTGISTKSVYAQRNSACKKLGLKSPRVVLSLPLYFH